MWICNNERSFMIAELPVCGKNTSNMNWYLCTSCQREVLIQTSKSLLRSNCIYICNRTNIEVKLVNKHGLSLSVPLQLPTRPPDHLCNRPTKFSGPAQFRIRCLLTISWHWCDTIRRYQTLKGIKTLQNGQPGVLIIYATHSHFFWTYTNWNLSFLNSQQGIIKINLQVRYDASVSRLLPHFSMFCKKSYLAITKMVPHD